MSLHPISKYLVDSVAAQTLLDGRFTDLKLVNFDSVNDLQRGCFSLVFRASDNSTGQVVALKFFDPAAAMDSYRLDCFHREFELLNSLRKAEGCLQLMSGLTKYQLTVPAPLGPAISFPCEYFAVDWIDDEIDHYFLSQHLYGAVEKLKLFRDLVSAVHALHRQRVFHRDLKPDNLRQRTINRLRSVVPIDLGTAARADAPNLQASYARPAGAPAYAAPEARCGLGGDRLVARYTDYYAMGCMLFELFNFDLYCVAHQLLNSTAPVLLAALNSSLDPHADTERRRMQWCSTMDRMSKAFVAVPIDGPGSDVPRGIAPLLNGLVRSLTHVDYRLRPTDLHWVQRKLTSCIRVLENEKLYQKYRQEARDERARRIARAAQKELRLKQKLNQPRRFSC